VSHTLTDCAVQGRFVTPPRGAAPLPVNLGDLMASMPADLVASYNDVMDRASKPVIDGIKSLQSATDGYSWAKLITLGPVWGTLLQAPEETRRAIHSALNTLDTRMQQLTASRAQVLAGTLDIKKWVAAVNTVLDGMKTQARDLGEGTLLNAISVQANDAAQSLKALLDKLAKIPEDIATGLKWGIPVAVGAVGILAILVVPKLLGGTTVVVGRGTGGLGSLRRRRRRGNRRSRR
jgi:hypothetical protein